MQFGKRTCVFLDRDGVINKKLPEGQYITRPEQIELLPGVVEAIRTLNQAGCIALVVTNQRAIGLGLLSEMGLAEIHEHLRLELEARGARLDAIYYCPHDKNSCHCRKPEIGMIKRAFQDFPDASANNSILIGDSISDIEAGRRAGIPTIFIHGDPANQKPGAEKAIGLADAKAHSLLSAVNQFIFSNP